MTTLRFARMALAVASATALGSCVARTVDMAPRYAPSERSMAEPSATAGKLCLIHLAGVHDLRTDPHSLGGVIGQKVRVEDSAEWVRSGIESLADGSTIRLADQGDALSLDVDLLKAYLVSITSETRSANVVLRIRYSRAGQPVGEQIYRGTDSGLVWTGGDDETQSSLNAVLGKALQTIRTDVLARCAADTKTPMH